jgi:tRNA 5-methylaminomethyl-2-thiouridine biosynthesis bifunctional protein
LENAEVDWNGPIPVSLRFHDVYASTAGALADKRYVFLTNNFLPERWRQARWFAVGELGFGTGLTFLATWALWRETAPAGARLHFFSVEHYPLRREDLTHALHPWSQLAPLAEQLLRVWPIPEPGFHRLILEPGRVDLTLLFGDVQEMLPRLQGQVDAWLLDGFAPAVNEAMWSESVFRELVVRTRPGGTFATYTAAGRVRRRLEAVGFSVEKRPGFGRKKEMLRGRLARTPVDEDRTPWFHIPRSAACGPRAAVVIGAGLVGTATAQALARRGWRVILVERRDAPARGASGNAAGIVAPPIAGDRDPMQRWAAAAYRYALRHFRGLGQAVEWASCGVLLAAWDERSRRRQQRFLEMWKPPPETIRPVDAMEASRLCGLAVAWEGLYVPDGSWVHPPSVCRAQLSQQGILALFGEEAQSLERCGDGWRVLGPEGRLIASAPLVIVAGGEDAAAFAQTSGLPLRAVRGQITELEATSRSEGLGVVVCGPGYATPARNGRHCIGATYDLEDRDREPSERDHQRNRELLRRFFSTLADALADSPAAGRVAFRCVSPDHVPVVGPVPDEGEFKRAYGDLDRGFPPSRYPPAPCHPGLYVNAGHGSRGLSYAPLAAELLAAMIEGEPLPLEHDLVNSLHPARFLVRELRKRGSS